MTTINRATAESEVINIFLDLLRNELTDPISPKRSNSNWIRSQIQYKEQPTVNYGRKKFTVKNSMKVGFPQVIIGEYSESNEKAVIGVNSDGNPLYSVSCELKIFLEDTGHAPSVLGNLSGQISNVLYANQKTNIRDKGISNLNWDVVTTYPYKIDDTDYIEKQIVLTFNLRLSEWK